MKKSHLIGTFTSFVALSLCAVSMVISKSTDQVNVEANEQSYTLNVNNLVFGASSLTSSYQDTVVQEFGEYKPVLNYHLAKKDGSNNLVLAPAGRIYNYKSTANYKGRLTNMLSLTVNYSGGKLFVQEGLNGDAKVYGPKVAITSGTPIDLTSNPNFIMITNSKAETTVTGMSITYKCSEAGFTVGRLGEKYTTNDSVTGKEYELVRNGNQVSVAGQNGTIAVNNDGTFTISLAGGNIVYQGTVSSDTKTLTVTGKSGAYAQAAPEIETLNRVYVMDDFESYEQNGTTFTGNPSHEFDQNLAYVKSTTASDLRAAYYSDFGGGGNNTWVKGSNFQIPTSSDFINLTTAEGAVHSGNKAITVKGSTGGWMRYWSREIFDQNQHYNFGKGNAFVFWVHSPYTNTACTTQYEGAKKAKIKVQVYYKNFVIDNDSRNYTSNGTGPKDYTLENKSGWREIVIPIDPSKEIYAFNIMVDNTLNSNVYIPIDDLQIVTFGGYTPTKKFENTSTRITKSYHGSVSTPAGAFTVKVGLGANGYIYAYCGDNMEPTGYTINGNQIAITTTGSYKNDLYDIDADYGNWTGTLSNNNNTITINKSDITGSIKSIIKDNVITLTQDNVGITGNETLSQLETMFRRQYNGGSWTTDTSNTDRLSSTSNYAMEGTNALRVRPYSSGAMRLTVIPDVATAHGAFDSVAFWYYVPVYTKYTISVFTYKNADCDTNKGYAQSFTHTYAFRQPEDAGWHYVNLGLDKKGGFGRNFAIFVDTCSVETVIDYVTYF